MFRSLINVRRRERESERARERESYGARDGAERLVTYTYHEREEPNHRGNILVDMAVNITTEYQISFAGPWFWCLGQGQAGSGQTGSDRSWVFQPKADGVTSTFAYTEVASVVRSVRNAGVRA